LSSFSAQPSTSDPDTTERKALPSWDEAHEPGALLRALAANLREELPERETGLTTDFQGTRLAIVYHHVVIMRWTTAADELICTPVGWHGRVTAAGREEARTIAIRLVFEFVRQFRAPIAADQADPCGQGVATERTTGNART
jgi:hypothetical protein